MKVSSTSSSSVATARGPSRPAADGGFAPEGAAAASESSAAAPVSSLNALSSVASLLALQETLSAPERRRRAVGRAGRLLDMLDGMKLAILGEGDGAAVLTSLSNAIREQRFDTEDPGLDGVLTEIDTRAQVELAKQEMARHAA